MAVTLQRRGLGDARADIIGWLRLVYGDAAPAKFDSAVTYLKSEAKAGAEEAIPTIKSAITPLVVAAALAGVAGLATGIAAIVIAKRRPA